MFFLVPELKKLTKYSFNLKHTQGFLFFPAIERDFFSTPAIKRDFFLHFFLVARPLVTTLPKTFLNSSISFSERVYYASL